MRSIKKDSPTLHKHVIISVSTDLVTDQRVNRIATTLYQNNYIVLLIGRKLPSSKPITRNYKTKRLKLIFKKSFLFYAEYNLRLFFILLFTKSDILLANDTDTLPANYLVSKIKRKKLVFDAHEMFPEMPELINKPFVRSFWEKIEDFIFPNLKHCYTVSQSIANAYNKKYNIHMQVIRNMPLGKRHSVQPKLVFERKKILLYQGAVNIGRGIEWIIDAMPYMENVVFCIVGTGDILEILKEKVEKQELNDKVFFYGQIPFEELQSYTVSADLGISLLENMGLNYYYSLPNRIFDFIHAGVPVLATDFPEIQNIVNNYGIGRLVSSYEPELLAKKIETFLKEWENTPNKQAVFHRAQKELCWENEEKKIITIFKKVF